MLAERLRRDKACGVFIAAFLFDERTKWLVVRSTAALQHRSGREVEHNGRFLPGSKCSAGEAQ